MGRMRMRLSQWAVWMLVLGAFLLIAGFVLCDEDAVDAEEELDLNEVAEENDVLILTDKNFDGIIADNDIVLVEFYAPWCGHCKSLAPEYEKAAGILKENDPNVVLAKVDATVETTLASQYGVSGYPTLMFFKNGQSNSYDGPRFADGIVQYMQTRADPSWKPPPEAVLTLTKSNFSEIVDSAELILVEFYAPWCGHCKQLAPEFEKAAKELKTSDPPIPLAKVDATQESDLAREYEITGYPTLKMFRRGKAYEFKGERQAQPIINYMRKERRPPSVDLFALSDIKRFMKTDDVTLVGFFKAKDAAFDIYENAANDLRSDYDLGHTFSREAINAYKINAPASIVVFTADNLQTKYEQKYHIKQIEESTTSEEIRSFIEEHSVPLVGEYKSSTRLKRYGNKYPLLLMFYSVDWSNDGIKATQLWRLKLADIAKDFRDITFAIANEDDHATLLKGFGFDDSGEEINIGILNEKDRKFPMPTFDSFDSDEIREFIEAYKAGKLSPKYKSQPVPKKSKSAVKTVVGSTFAKIVGDKSKDVVIEFMSPNCAKCKEFSSKYAELAKKYAKTEKNLIFAKIDNSANEFPDEYIVDAFPCFYMVPAKGSLSSPAKFDNDEELTPENLMKFVKENAKVSLTGKDEL